MSPESTLPTEPDWADEEEDEEEPLVLLQRDESLTDDDGEKAMMAKDRIIILSPEIANPSRSG